MGCYDNQECISFGLFRQPKSAHTRVVMTIVKVYIWGLLWLMCMIVGYYGSYERVYMWTIMKIMSCMRVWETTTEKIHVCMVGC
jgi:hypothetical protein